MARLERAVLPRPKRGALPTGPHPDMLVVCLGFEPRTSRLFVVDRRFELLFKGFT